MEKMIRTQDVLKMLNFDTCRQMLVGSRSPAAERMMVSRMRKGDFRLYEPDVKKLLSELYEIKSVLIEAIEELEMEHPKAAQVLQEEWSN